MTLTVFAVATTGLVHFDKPLGDPTQPRMVALAAFMYSKRMVEKGAFHLFTRPEGTASTTGARQVHGITERERDLFGVRLKVAIATLMDMTRASTEIAAYSLDFCTRLIEIELHHLKADTTDWRRGGLVRTSIMQAATARYNGGKAMTLGAAHAAATGVAYESPTHDKHIHDARAATRILMELRR